MTPLEPAHLTVLRLTFAINALIVVVLFLFADVLQVRRDLLPFGLVTGAGVVLALLMIVVMPRRRYRAWGYEPREDELVVKHGLMIRRLTVVPFGRVQHIDVAQGPLQRPFALATLVLNTAGTRGAAVKLPGLAIGTAEAMRDHIRGKIRQDLA